MIHAHTNKHTNSLCCMYLTVLPCVRASRGSCGGPLCGDVPDRDDGGRRLSAGLQTEAAQSVSTPTHTHMLFPSKPVNNQTC